MSSTEENDVLLHRCVGAIIASRRKALGFSQVRLATISGVDRTFISHVENGTRNASLSTLIKIARALNMRLSRIIGLAENLM